MLENKLISIGKIIKPIGLKGYVKVLSLTDFPDRFKSLKSIRLFSEKENSILKNKFSDTEDFIIKDVIYERDYLKILFDGYCDINSVSNMIGCFLVLDDSQRKKLDKGRFYYDELIGLDVISDGEEIGKTVSVENYGGQDLFKIKLNSLNKEVLVPFVDEFIKNIDVKNKFIEINVIDGMLN